MFTVFLNGFAEITYSFYVDETLIVLSNVNVGDYKQLVTYLKIFRDTENSRLKDKKTELYAQFCRD